jgi:hypothetical protein
MLLLLAALLQAPTVERTGTFASPRVLESSGVAVSRTHAGILWTHNDSGDGPYLYATDLAGRDHGVVRVEHAEAFDWEDLALGRCPQGAGDCLFIGDIGDNFETRPWVTVYAVPEPVPTHDTASVVAAAATLRVRYPDGAHDAETLYVSPRDGALFLVTKGRTPPIRVYRVARERWGDTLATATRVQTLDLAVDPSAGRWITGGAIRRDGRVVALRTLREIYFYVPDEVGQLHSIRHDCRIGVVEHQGEAIDFLDADRLVLTSEADGPRKPGQIHLVRCWADGP